MSTPTCGTSPMALTLHSNQLESRIAEKIFIRRVVACEFSPNHRHGVGGGCCSRCHCVVADKSCSHRRGQTVDLVSGKALAAGDCLKNTGKNRRLAPCRSRFWIKSTAPGVGWRAICRGELRLRARPAPRVQPTRKIKNNHGDQHAIHKTNLRCILTTTDRCSDRHHAVHSKHNDRPNRRCETYD